MRAILGVRMKEFQGREIIWEKVDGRISEFSGCWEELEEGVRLLG